MLCAGGGGGGVDEHPLCCHPVTDSASLISP